ncbi:MAG TPA: molybdenum cofactor biosynthesis protein MoaE [Bryobacteraceae bacterium]|nr:molybdenum cofactor biosynthesis protein MoaE [Bryobacteraceae bacterium]
MRIRVLFFGVLRDVTGLREDSIEIPEGGLAASVFDHYSARFPRLGEMSKSIVLAVNQKFCAPSEALVDGDELAFLPPVSGGNDGNIFALTRDPIDAATLARQVLRGEDGAIVTFEGVTRNNTKGRPTQYLEYECYEAMALKTMAGIGEEIARTHQISRIAMVHRLGRIEIGETSVVVIAAAPHRRPAFEASLEGINKLKRLVPVWKKEYFEDGEVWVDGEWDESVIKAGS